MNELTARFAIIGCNDSRDFCECCGKKGLKRVVWVLDRETGEHKHFGTTCVLAPTKAFGLDHEVRAAVREAEYREKQAARAATWAYRAAGGTYNKVGPGRWVVANRALWDQCMKEAA